MRHWSRAGERLHGGLPVAVLIEQVAVLIEQDAVVEHVLDEREALALLLGRHREQCIELHLRVAQTDEAGLFAAAGLAGARC